MLEAKNVTYTYHERNLIEEVSVSFAPGNLSMLMGPNGAGKTTLLKTLLGIWQPSQGKVLLNGKPINQISRRMLSRTLAFVPQKTQIPFNFTVLEIVAMGRYSHKAENPDLLLKALQMVDCWHLRNRTLPELSGGEQQRVYIARALVTESPILLLDEPTANLDMRHQLEIWQLLTTLAAQGKTVIVANHDLSIAHRFSDHITILNQGHLVAQGPYHQVITPDLLNKVFGVHGLHRTSFREDLDPISLEKLPVII